MKNLMRTVLLLGLLLLMSSCNKWPITTNTIVTTTTSTLTTETTTIQSEVSHFPVVSVAFIDVGQGDSSLVNIDDKHVLIDCGDRNDLAFNFLQHQGINKIDFLIITHPHADHYAGCYKILGIIPVGQVYENGVDNKFNGLPIPSILNISGLSIQSFQSGLPSINDNSIILHLDDYLFTGDCGFDCEQSLIHSSFNISARTLKLGHHGSRTSSSDVFLSLVSPELAVISVGANNTYGHPSNDTLARLATHRIESWRTDINGSIITTHYSFGG
jgi:competence protein ComEC